jgi:hypothetical protein
MFEGLEILRGVCFCFDDIRVVSTLLPVQLIDLREDAPEPR